MKNINNNVFLLYLFMLVLKLNHVGYPFVITVWCWNWFVQSVSYSIIPPCLVAYFIAFLFWTPTIIMVLKLICLVCELSHNVHPVLFHVLLPFFFGHPLLFTIIMVLKLICSGCELSHNVHPVLFHVSLPFFFEHPLSFTIIMVPKLIRPVCKLSHNVHPILFHVALPFFFGHPLLFSFSEWVIP